MKRRDQGISNAWSFLLGFAILTVVVPGVLIGPARAVRIIGSAVSGTVLQYSDPEGTVEKKEHQLPVVELLSTDNELVYNGVHFPIRIEGSGDDVIVHFDTVVKPPFGPFESIMITQPGSELLGATLAMWIAGKTGVPVPFGRLIYLKRDGSDAGVHVLREHVTDRFEEYRNISNGPVPVFTRNPDVEDDADPWNDPQNWLTSGPVNSEAQEQFNELIASLNDTLISNSDRRMALEQMIDVEAFNRYHAAHFVLGANAPSQVDVALVMNPRTLKFYPVVTDAPLVPAAGELVIATDLDLLAERMMSISDWRLQRDEFVREALQDLHVNGTFNRNVEELSALVAPALTTAGRSRTKLFSMNSAGASDASLQWSTDDLVKRVGGYWDRILPVVAGEVGGANEIVP